MLDTFCSYKWLLCCVYRFIAYLCIAWLFLRGNYTIYIELAAIVVNNFFFLLLNLPASVATPVNMLFMQACQLGIVSLLLFKSLMNIFIIIKQQQMIVALLTCIFVHN